MSAEPMTAEERDLIEATLDRAPGCPDKECRVCREIAAGKAAWAKALRELETLRLRTRKAEGALLQYPAADSRRVQDALEALRGE